MLTEIAMKGDYQAYIGSSLTGPDSLATLRCYHSKTPRTACNYTSFNNPDFDKLLDEAGQTGDMAKRTDLLQKANTLLYDEAPVWFFNYNKAVLALSAVDPRPAGQPDRDHAPVSAKTSGSTRPRRRSDGDVDSSRPSSSRDEGLRRIRTDALVLARRLANVVPTLLAVVALVFLLFSVLPGQLHLGHGRGRPHDHRSGGDGAHAQGDGPRRSRCSSASPSTSPTPRWAISARRSARASR